MKKTARFLSLALVCLMLLPLLSALPVKVKATEPALTYDTAEEGELLRAVNFNESYWKQGFADNNNKGADVVVSEDGTSVKLTVQNANNKRAMWGGFYPGAGQDEDEYEAALGAVLPMKAGAKYTMVFDLKLGSDNVAFGIQVDGNNALNIRGNGQSTWWGWNTQRVGETEDNNEKWNYHYASGSSKRDKQTYAIVVDYDAETMDLYIVDSTNGCFYFCRSIAYDVTWDSAYFRCRLSARRISGTPDSSFSADFSNFRIYKGNALKQMSGNGYQLGYLSRMDGDTLLDVDFDSEADWWDPGFLITGDQADNNDDLEIAVTDEGDKITFTSINANNRRGIWGSTLPADFFPLTAGTKYTVYFTLTMDAGMKCAFYPDGKQGIVIIQNSTYTKYQNWSTMSGTEANWANKTDCGSGLKKFAVEIDYDTGTLTLYGRNINGLYSYINQATGLTFDSDVLYCAFWAGNTAGNTVTVSGVSIEKGLTVEELDKAAIGYTAYQAIADNTLLKTMNFNEVGWNPGFASDSNKGADIEISNDGSSVEFTIHNGDNYRAMWGAPLTDTLPLYNDVQYTFLYDVTFGNENVSVALFPDADNGLVIYGNGTVQWYRWNTQRGGISQKWNDYTDVEGLTQTFAVAMDYKTEYLYLYVKQSNGTFRYVTRQTCSDPWDAVSNLYCQFRVAGGNKSNPPDATYTATVSNLRIYKGLNLTDRYVLETADGAAVRLSNPTGLRFTGYIGKDLLDELKAKYGNANVKVGMLITPTDYLTANSLDFTKEALDGCGSLPAGKKYVKIEASTILESEDGNAYKINCVLSNVLEANYGRKFSAVTYIEVNGSTYYYADYSEENNARSISYVAEAALLDLSDTQTGEYQYAVEATAKFSPYTESQRATLEGFSSAESFTVMSYNIEMFEGSWDGRAPEKVIETILEEDPDVVGLQEVDYGWPSYINTLKSNGYGQVQGNTDKTAWNELLYKTSKYNKLNSGYETFRDGLDEHFDGVVDPNGADNSRDKMYRTFVWARLQDKETGKIVLAICTHLHYRKNSDDTASTDENAAVRQYEVRLLLAWIAEKNYECDGIVIFGDMNAHYLEAEGGRGRRVIDVYRNEGGFAVARDSAAIKGDTGGTLATTGRTTRPEWIYDYVLTRGNVSALSFTVVDNKIDSGGTTYPSDHLPVKATILFD